LPRYRTIAKRVGGRRKLRFRITPAAIAFFAALCFLPIAILLAALVMHRFDAACRPDAPTHAAPADQGGVPPRRLP
jgi:hypothetical protein